MTEIFANSISVAPYRDPENEYEFTNLLIIRGKGWEGEPFDLYINEDEAQALFVQLGYYLQ